MISNTTDSTNPDHFESGEKQGKVTIKFSKCSY